MNVSSIVVQALPENVEKVVESLKANEECDYHFHDKEKGKIIVTIEGESVDEEIQKLKVVQRIPHVVSADMMMSYSEDELDRERENLGAQDSVPPVLNDDSVDYKDVVYHGDLKYKGF